MHLVALIYMRYNKKKIKNPYIGENNLNKNEENKKNNKKSNKNSN
jgi:hypothetical protein